MEGMVKRNIVWGWASARGFSLVDQMLTLGLIVTVAAIAVPSLKNTIDGQRLGMEARSIEREMQLARLNAVTTNRPIRLRFNCPSAGYYRRVELIGSANNPNTGDDADNRAAIRCGTTYPFPAADNDPITKPNNDGPVMQLNSKVAFQAVQTLEFWPNGTVHTYNAAAAPWPPVSAAPVNIILTSAGVQRSVTVNALGKTQIQ
jgi:Tfp pilus assembly protein FimT